MSPKRRKSSISSAASRSTPRADGSPGPARPSAMPARITARLTEPRRLSGGSAIRIAAGDGSSNACNRQQRIFGPHHEHAQGPRRHQIMLRVKIAELDRTAARNFGVNFARPIEFRNGTLLLQSLLNASNSNSVIGNFSNDQLSFGISYLEQHGVVRLMSEPTLMAMSGKPANFIAGGEFAVPTGRGHQRGRGRLDRLPWPTAPSSASRPICSTRTSFASRSRPNSARSTPPRRSTAYRG